MRVLFAHFNVSAPQPGGEAVSVAIGDTTEVFALPAFGEAPLAQADFLLLFSRLDPHNIVKLVRDTVSLGADAQIASLKKIDSRKSMIFFKIWPKVLNSFFSYFSPIFQFFVF